MAKKKRARVRVSIKWRTYRVMVDIRGTTRKPMSRQHDTKEEAYGEAYALVVYKLYPHSKSQREAVLDELETVQELEEDGGSDNSS